MDTPPHQTLISTKKTPARPLEETPYTPLPSLWLISRTRLLSSSLPPPHSLLSSKMALSLAPYNSPSRMHSEPHSQHKTLGAEGSASAECPPRRERWIASPRWHCHTTRPCTAI
ncbi:hypothetical protein PanWU01x14_188740 [Parasponia andersonii]|uniref:Uncharacterized protein n=1 Tax=Parasponia andersonii TaxID=3476 RepID=A0A2P5C2T6_PARAD|nr:hypothetical protein PanWU01x14_188740 [Parasponia andersonii]